MSTRRPRLRPFLAVCLLPFLIALPAHAGEPLDPEPPAGRLELATERVVVFKDGYALFVKRAEGRVDAEGHVHTFEVPDAAVLGTFWATAADGRLLGMHAEWVQAPATEQELPCATVSDLLAANVGRHVELGTTLPERPVIRGALEDVLRVPGSARAASRNVIPTIHRPQGSAPLPESGPVRLIVISAGDGERLVLPVESIQTVAGEGLKTTRMVVRQGARQKRLSFDVGPAAAGTDVALQILYFRPGLRWIPTYRVGGPLVTSADLALQAEVVNEAEDLRGVPLHLVVGVPNFRFKDVVSPLALESALQGALHSVADNQAILMSQNRLSNSFSNADSATTGLASGDGAIHLAPELASQGVQDLFVYEAPAMDLAKGARATVPLWTSSASAAHVYTFERDIQRDHAGRRQRSSARSRRGRESPAHLDRNDVWHQLELDNGSTTPWTTGAALLLQEGQPIAQEILGYTAPGAKTLLPITVATDLKAVHVEEEVTREARAYRWGDHLYAEITLRGRVTLTSFRREASTTRVRLTLSGRASEVGGGTVTLDATEGGVNPRSRLAWDLELAPGETKTLGYELTFYAN